MVKYEVWGRRKSVKENGRGWHFGLTSEGGAQSVERGLLPKVGWMTSLLNDLRATARSAAFENEAGCTEAEVSYAPFPIWIWLNGDEWAKRQLEKARVGYETLDNGFRACTDRAVLEKICDRLGPREIRDFFWRWFARLPCPLTQADVRAGYGYAWACRQYEVSETCVFDRLQAGRMWFEGVIRDHLEIGRPDGSP